MTTVTPRDRIRETRERFIDDVAEHQMEVILDEGLHRHIRFQRPNTSMYHFDLVTWPGYLAITGDCGSFVFSRTRDMFEFFVDPVRSGASGSTPGRSMPRRFAAFRASLTRAGKRVEEPRQDADLESAFWVKASINPHYWSEKLQAPKPDGAERFSEEIFRERVMEWLEQTRPSLTEAAELRQEVERQIFDQGAMNEYEAHRLVNEFEWAGRRIYDSWEWSFRDWDWQFLWCCWAIVWGIGRYRARDYA